jgi:hypothetical protein
MRAPLGRVLTRGTRRTKTLHPRSRGAPASSDHIIELMKGRGEVVRLLGDPAAVGRSVVGAGIGHIDIGAELVRGTAGGSLKRWTEFTRFLDDGASA